MIFKQRAAVYNEKLELVDGRFLERSYIPFSGTVFIKGILGRMLILP
jgi:hypothetical protein